MGLALRRPAVAAADDALLIPGGQSAPLGLGDGPGESAQVQPLEIRVEVDGADIGVAQQPEQLVAREQAVLGAEQAGRFSADQPGDGAGGGDDGYLRPGAALAGQVQAGAVGGVPQEIVHRVVPTSADAAGVTLDPVAVHKRVGYGLKQREGLRVQGPGEVTYAVRRLVG